MIYLLEDNQILADCLVSIIKKTDKNQTVRHFKDTITAIQNLDCNVLPSLIFLDILLTGPDGFTFLNELASYQDTAKIPVVIVTSLNLQGQDLSAYGVVGILDKETMHPADVAKYVKEYS